MNNEERVLIFTSTRKDAESTGQLLARAGLSSYICTTMDCLIEELSKGVGALLLAKETLIASNLDRLKEAVESQPSWSDLPTILLASTGDLAQGKKETARVLKALRNTTILERPVRVTTMISVVEASVADRKRQYEVRDLLKALEKAKEESDRANKAKSDFLANMSHEIRTPLGAVLGFTELALEPKLPLEERRSYSQAVQRNGQILLGLVNDILDLAKIEAGKIEIEEVNVSITEIVSDVVMALMPIAKEKRLSLNLDVEKDVPAIAYTDPVRTRQIVMNLLSNAVKFTSEGSISLHLWKENSSETHHHLILEVSDTGLGIPLQLQGKLFQPFTQADSSMTRAFGGTGLGLVLSRKLAIALGGNLELVKSEPGVGSTFKLSFPVGTVIGKVTEKKKSQTLDQPQIVGLRVLLVEDSPDNRVLLSRLLSLEGVVVATAKDGVEGVEKAMTNDFDVVLMDVQMPKLDGNAATLHLRKEGYRKPIIALTAHALKSDREQSMRHGFDDYLTKPVQREALFDSLRKYKTLEDARRKI